MSQVQMLETSKMKLELEITQMKKDFRREIQCREDDLEDIRYLSTWKISSTGCPKYKDDLTYKFQISRASNSKKVKVLEQQLEQEHEERMGFVREKHDLESKIMNLQDLLDRSSDEELVIKLKKDLKRTKALLKDAQMYMDKNQTDGTSKVIVRQLKNQV